MGWISAHRDKGISNADYFNDLLGSDRTILANATINGAFYAAVRDDDDGQVWGFVALVQWTRGFYNFTYKDMSETMGPAVTDAPAKVLDLLTPTDHEHALAWRKQCRASSDHKQRASTALRGLRDGDTITLRKALRFSDGQTRDTFTVALWPDRAGRKQVQLSDEHVIFNVPRWRSRVASVVKNGERITVSA